MNSLITKSLIGSGLIVASLAWSGSAVMAANLPVVHKKAPVVHVSRSHAAARVAARYRQPRIAGYNDLGQFIEHFFGGALPPQYARLIASAAAHASASHRGSGGYESSYDPSLDSPSPSVSVDNSQSEAAIEQSDADTNAMVQSMQATQEQNDAAEADFNAGIAAAQQTEINAGM